MTEQLLTAAMLVVPAAGWAAGAILPARRSFATVISAGLTFAAAVLWSAYLFAGALESPTSISAGNWLTIPSSEHPGVQLSFQADQLRVLLVLAASLFVLLEVVASIRPESDSETRSSGLVILYPLSVVSILATDLVVLVSVWLFIDCCVFGLQRHGDEPVHTHKRNFRTAVVLSGSGAFLLLAMLIATTRFGTTNLTEIINLAVQDGRVDTAAVVSGLTVLLAAAVAVRCAFFPAIIWPRDFLRTSPRDAALIVVLAGILPGISLAVAVLPFCEISGSGCLLVGMFGVLTCLTSTGVALAQRNSAGVSTLLMISAAGLSAAALMTGHPSAGEIAICTLFAQVVAILILKQSSRDSRRGVAFAAAISIAVSGIGGSNAVLSIIEHALRGNADSTGLVSTHSDRLMQSVWWAIAVSQVLWGMAVVRLVSVDQQTPSSGVPERSSDSVPARGRPAAVLTIVAAILTLGVCVLPLGNFAEADPSPQIRLLSFGAATPACLLGVVSAWLLCLADDSVRSRIAGCFDSLTRLNREWFYLDSVFQNGVILPVRGLARLAEFCDRRILGGTSEDGWKRSATSMADSLEYLRLQPAIYYGLTAVLLVVGLLWSLI